MIDLKKELENRLPYHEDKADMVISIFKEELNKINIKYEVLELLGTGESTIAFAYKNKVIKLTSIDWGIDLKDYVSDSSAILPIDYEREIDFGGFYKYRLVITDKVKTGNITEKDTYNMYCRLRNDGYLWEDTRIDNLGYDKNNNLVLFDYGELINLNRLDYFKQQEKLEYHKDRKPEYDKYYKKMLTDYNNEIEKISLMDKFKNRFSNKK